MHTLPHLGVEVGGQFPQLAPRQRLKAFVLNGQRRFNNAPAGGHLQRGSGLEAVDNFALGIDQEVR